MTYVIHHAHMYRPDPARSARIYEAPPLAMRVLACDWPGDLPFLRDYLRDQLRGRSANRHVTDGWSGAYALSGTTDGCPLVRIGEGARLWDRLPHHKGDRELAFAREIHVVCAEHYDKTTVVYLQEALTDAATAAGHARVVHGVGPQRLPVPAYKRAALVREASAAAELLALAGCFAFMPPHRMTAA